MDNNNCHVCESGENFYDKEYDQFQLSSEKNRNLFIFYLLFLVFILSIVVSTEDIDLLTGYSNIQFPFTYHKIKLIVFYIYAPFFILLFYFILLFNALKHRDKIFSLKKSKNKLIINKKIIPPFLLNFVYSTEDHFLVKEYVNIMYIWTTPIVLILFLSRFSDYQDFNITIWHFFTIICSLIITAFWFNPLPVGWYKSKKKLFCVLIFILVFILVLVFILIHICLIYNIEKIIYYVNDNVNINYLSLFFIGVIVVIFLMAFLKQSLLIYAFFMFIISIIASFYFLIALNVYGDKLDFLKSNYETNTSTNIYNIVCKKNKTVHHEDFTCKAIFPRIFIHSNTKLLGKLNQSQNNKHSIEFISLIERSFKFSHMHGVNLDNSDLRYSDFFSAHLKSASIKSALINEANLTNAQLQNSDFTCSNLEKADFNKSNLYNAKMWGTSISPNNFKNANISNSEFHLIKISSTDYNVSTSICHNEQNVSLYSLKKDSPLNQNCKQGTIDHGFLVVKFNQLKKMSNNNECIAMAKDIRNMIDNKITFGKPQEDE